MTETNEQPGHVEYGDRETAMHNEILRTVVGSGVHGIAIEGTDDHDEMGVFVEPVRFVIGLSSWDYKRGQVAHVDLGNAGMPHFNYRTQPEGARSGPGDVDRIMYSLRKYARMAAIGNPTALLPLFAPEKDVLVMTEAGRALREVRDRFLSQRAVHRFLGYMREQHERMLGQGPQGKVPNRPELVERYGYDVKYASHALRLAMQGHEVCVRGTLTLPMPEHQRDTVLAVKRGEVSQEQVSRWITDLAQRTQGHLDSGATPLPMNPDWDNIERMVVAIHLDDWGFTD